MAQLKHNMEDNITLVFMDLNFFFFTDSPVRSAEHFYHSIFNILATS